MVGLISKALLLAGDLFSRAFLRVSDNRKGALIKDMRR
jgi:hypothetical protein